MTEKLQRSTVNYYLSLTLSYLFEARSNRCGGNQGKMENITVKVEVFHEESLISDELPNHQQMSVEIELGTQDEKGDIVGPVDDATARKEKGTSHDVIEKSEPNEEDSHEAENSDIATSNMETDKPYPMILYQVDTKERMSLQIVDDHHGNQSSQCTFSPSNSSSENSEMWLGKSEGTEEPYTGSLCQYNCAREGKLKRHQLTYTGEESYTGSLCPHSLTKKGSSNLHQLTDTGQKPYKCPLCPYSCTRTGDLKRHQLTDNDEITDLDVTDTDSSDDDIPLRQLRRFSSGSEIEPTDDTEPESSTSRTTTTTQNPENPEWKSNLTTVTVGQFSEETGPVFVLEKEKNELDFLNLLFPETLFDHLTEQTNLYARQCAEKTPDPKWTETNSEEMKAFIGLHVLMSVIQLPSYKNYWATEQFFKIPSVPMVMTRPRFEKLLQYFHLSDSTTNPPRGQPGHDKLHHIAPVFNVVQERLIENYRPHMTVSIHEAMIPFRGRLSYRQYLPAEPCTFGIKVWELADSTNGYVYQMQVYTGKTDGDAEKGLASRVVVDLTRRLVGKNFHVYMDNFFSSPNLFEKLHSDGIYAAGTCRVDRKGWPDSLYRNCLEKQRGVSKALQKGNLVATSWYDKRQVNFLSTNSDPTVVVQIKRKPKDGTRADIPAPEVVSKYGDYMAGVDHGDQLRLQYPSARRAKKYWKYLFWFLFDTALASSFILMKESPNHKIISRKGRAKTRTQLDFRKNLAKQLIGRFRQKRRCDAPSPCDKSGRSHWPTVMSKSRRCKQCAHVAKRRKESKYGCEICDVNLCVECFGPFHTRVLED